MNPLNSIKKWYETEGCYLEFLKIAVPLIISTGIVAIQIFTDRVFLSWYSQEAYAASIPAGVCNFAIESIFLYTLAYIDVFVAQYYGKKEYRSIGPAIWQSVYLAVVAAFILLVISFFSEKFFMSIGHSNVVELEEIKYFKALCYGAFPAISATALSGFYAGRGKTSIVLLISICSVVVNIILDFCLIFGNFGFPKMGIAGAALATNLSFVTMFVIYVLLIITKKNSDVYNTRQIALDFTFMKRLLRYGFPNGVTVFFDMSEFGIFMLIIGTLGISELTASNIAVSVYHIAIMPIIGGTIAISIMVGNYLGQNKVSFAQKSIKSAAQIVYAYVAFVAIILLLLPNQLIYPFSIEMQTMEYVRPMAISLLRILAIYMIFNAGILIVQSAIKGAGDTLFVMKIYIFASMLLVVVPVWLIVKVFKFGIYAAWLSLMGYAIALIGIFYFRYRSGKWKNMRVIDMKVISESSQD